MTSLMIVISNKKMCVYVCGHDLCVCVHYTELSPWSYCRSSTKQSSPGVEGDTTDDSIVVDASLSVERVKYGY